MGYTTDFDGEFLITNDEPMKPEHVAYLSAFNRTRRMARNARLTEQRPDPVREAVGLPVGPQGAYFVGSDLTNFGQEHADDVVDFNAPPTGQPGLWCQWAPAEDGTAIVWDEGEKFYDYVEWLKYLVEHFLGPWGYRLEGEVQWDGEESGDMGIIRVTSEDEPNKIEVLRAHIEFR